MTKEIDGFESNTPTSIVPHRDLLSELKVRAAQRRRERELEEYLSDVRNAENVGICLVLMDGIKSI